MRPSPETDLKLCNSVDLPQPFGPVTSITLGTSSQMARLILRWSRMSKLGILTVPAPLLLRYEAGEYPLIVPRK